MAQINEVQTIEIPQGRYDDLIRTETKYNLLRNALEDEIGYTDIDRIKRCFGIQTKAIFNERKEIEE